MKKLVVLTAVLLAAYLVHGPATAANDRPAVHAPIVLDARALGKHSLGVASLPELQLLATDGGRATLARAVACALPIGSSITLLAKSGTPYSFSGAIGLAPAWAQRPATAHEQRRIAACAAR